MSSARDIILIAILLLVSGVVLFTSHYITNTYMEIAKNNEILNSSQQAVDVYNKMESETARWDYIFMAIFVGLVIGVLVTGWLVAGNQLFMFLYMTFMVIAVIISPIMSNTYESVTTSAVFGSTTDAFPITNFIMDKLPIFISAIGFLGFTVMFAKSYAGSGQL
jgi:hypothetical protein